MSTELTAPARPTLPGKRLWLVIAGATAVCVLGICAYWVCPTANKVAATTHAPVHLAPVANTPTVPPPSAPLRWTDKDMEQMLRLNRLEVEAEKHLQPKK